MSLKYEPSSEPLHIFCQTLPCGVDDLIELARGREFIDYKTSMITD